MRAHGSIDRLDQRRSRRPAAGTLVGTDAADPALTWTGADQPRVRGGMHRRAGPAVRGRTRGPAVRGDHAAELRRPAGIELAAVREGGSPPGVRTVARRGAGRLAVQSVRTIVLPAQRPAGDPPAMDRGGRRRPGDRRDPRQARPGAIVRRLLRAAGVASRRVTERSRRGRSRREPFSVVAGGRVPPPSERSRPEAIELAALRGLDPQRRGGQDVDRPPSRTGRGAGHPPRMGGQAGKRDCGQLRRGGARKRLPADRRRRETGRARTRGRASPRPRHSDRCGRGGGGRPRLGRPGAGPRLRRRHQAAARAGPNPAAGPARPANPGTEWSRPRRQGRRPLRCQPAARPSASSATGSLVPSRPGARRGQRPAWLAWRP